MRYKDLVHFEPIETVIQIHEADSLMQAKHLVKTFVISDNLAEQLCHIVIKQLQFDNPVDNKGLLIIGNYGTGKSHLMAVISAIAEHAEFSAYLNNEKAKSAFARIQGKFKVIRTEIGAVTKPLRDIICGYLEDGLSDMGIDYKFPPLSEIRSNKIAFQEMMSAFHAVYPEHGLLLVVDELLDYLRSRKEQELI